LVRSPNNSPDLVKEILPATLNGNWHGELMNQRKDGTEFPVFVSSSVVRDENNIPIALIGVSENITARKETENQIIKLNEELDHRVKLRTAELEAANHELETFSYSVSHDLKAPLRHINGFIDLFMEKKSSNFTDEELGYLKTISDAAKGMGQLIDALLSFSRLNSAELHKTNIDSSVIVKEVIKFFEPEFQNRKITFRVEQLPDSKGDERLMRQVWTNLISNAIKYTSKKPEAVIDIGSMATVGEITFFIKDNGAGFNMKYATKLFGVFQRMHKTSDFEGIGIGLANVNRIVRRHGGTCRAESEAGMGATFYFSLPD
jgi:light-regulated signal transduction histidine kinase (bacteriophytochrome)